MKKLLFTYLSLALAGLAANAQTVVQFDMDETSGTQITSLTADVGSGTWDNDISGVTTNGSGSLVSSGSVSGTSGLDITDLTSGIYEFTASDVVFNNIGGGSDDVFAFGFRSGSFNSSLVGTSGTFDSAVITVGNINGSGTLDAITRTDGTNRDTVNDFASISGTYSFTVQYDLDSDEASFFYDSGSGRNQIGSTVTGVSGAANYLAFSYLVNDFGGGDNIEVGGLTLTQVPEPSAYAFLTGLLALGWIAVRRRR